MQSLLLAILILCFMTFSALADQRSETVQQINLAKKEIATLQQALNKLKQQQTTSLKELRQTETQIATITKNITKLNKELTETQTKLVWLGEEQKKTEEKLTQQQQLFANQAKATYESGRQEYLKLLLNQQDPDKLSRLLVYYDYLSQARLVQLTEFKDTLAQLIAIQKDMAHYQEQLNTQNNDLQQQQKQLIIVRKKRRQVLANINNQIKDKNNRVTAREQDQIELNKVLKTIDDALTRQTAQSTVQQTNNANKGQQVTSNMAVNVTNSFSQAKGKLPWPVTGKIIASYGSTRGADSRSKWDGVLIYANRGTAVKAIHNGRVVYSDWLRGVGWLIIIDHGHGYYSLYGHNQNLLKKVGDTVKTGDTIATIGNSGGTKDVALYFSIRQQGNTVNPIQWCR